jgi:hypothetical protein
MTNVRECSFYLPGSVRGAPGSVRGAPSSVRGALGSIRGQSGKEGSVLWKAGSVSEKEGSGKGGRISIWEGKGRVSVSGKESTAPAVPGDSVDTCDQLTVP